MASDPHVLAALASVGIGHKIRTGENTRRSDAGASFRPAHGIIDDHPTHVRTFPVLDAIASICVSQPRSQVVAAALQVDNAKREIRLTIAENGLVRPEVVDHIELIWGMLRELSGQYARLRHDESDPQKWVAYRADSPEVPDNADARRRGHDIMSSVYRFTAAKNRRRIKKWWPKLVTFSQSFERDVKRGTLVVGADLQQRFLDTVMFLDEALGTLNKLGELDPISAEEWEDLVIMMDGATEEAGAVLAGVTPCETGNMVVGDMGTCELWAKQLKALDKDPFPLRRALEKLTSQHRHIQALLRFAHSPRLRLAFEYQVSIQAAPELPPPPIYLPTSSADWRRILEDLCQDHTFAHSDWLDEECDRLAQRFKVGPGEAFIHCECNLIAFLEAKKGDAWDAVPPFSYIGVSKLCCRSCYYWIETFNKLGGRQYYTRGTHGKWYWPWAMPNIPGAVVAEPLAKIMRQKYVKYQLATGKLHAASDSSDASTKSAKFEPNKSDVKVRAEMLRKRRAEGALVKNVVST